MNKLLWGVLVAALSLSPYTLSVQSRNSAAQDCPTGSYEVARHNGKPICKLEPTGCPYAENIPKDSPKCKPPQRSKPVQAKPIPKKTGGCSEVK